MNIKLIRLLFLMFITILSVCYDYISRNNKLLVEITLQGKQGTDLSVPYSSKNNTKRQIGTANLQQSIYCTPIKSGFK
jgi:hypothetical protein